MALPKKHSGMDIEAFKAFIRRPENEGHLFEFINGEIIEVSPGRTRNSQIAHHIVTAVYMYCRENNLPDYTSGGDGAYEIGGHVIAPDFAYKSTPMNDDYPDPEPPLLAVEIVSPTDKAIDIREKREIYEKAGILYWEVYPLFKSVDVYESGKAKRTLGNDDVLDGGSVLLGFQLPLRELFRP